MKHLHKASQCCVVSLLLYLKLSLFCNLQKETRRGLVEAAVEAAQRESETRPLPPGKLTAKLKVELKRTRACRIAASLKKDNVI